MSIDDELREAERGGDAERVAEIRKRLGDGPAQRLASEFRSEICELEQECRELERKITSNRERIEFLKSVCKAILPEPCPSCKGHGYWVEWVAQDESHRSRCEACNGTGFKDG